MINFKIMDSVELKGVTAYIHKKNELGKLVDLNLCKSVDWITGGSREVRAENFNFEKFAIDSINACFVEELKCSDISICDSYLAFWKQENAEGYEDEDGEYYVNYVVAIELNEKSIEEDDMQKIFPHFNY